MLTGPLFKGDVEPGLAGPAVRSEHDSDERNLEELPETSQLVKEVCVTDSTVEFVVKVNGQTYRVGPGHLACPCAARLLQLSHRGDHPVGSCTASLPSVKGLFGVERG